MLDLQILSDLHLEMVENVGEEWNIPVRALYLALLGDIAYTNSGKLFNYLETQLRRFKAVFFLLGNHEPYTSSWTSAKTNMHKFIQYTATKRKDDPFLRYFIFLDKTRFNLDPTVTILGCTLFTRVPDSCKERVSTGFNDFRLIQNWTVHAHHESHLEDLTWLNQTVTEIARTEPHRKVVILTHHSPSVDPRTIHPQHVGNPDALATAVRTDLSGELCWRSENVRLWAFGHTHFNLDFVDEKTGKRVVANQMGYISRPAKNFSAEKVVTI